MALYKLFLVRVFTYRWTEALVFYRDVLEFPLGFSDAKMGWAQFELEGAEIALEACNPDDAESKSLVGRFVGASIEVSDIYAVYQRLSKRGVEFIEPPEVQPWGGVLAHFKDLDGNVLTLLGKEAEGLS